MSKEAMKLALEAFKEIADETYDSWTNGAKAKRIAQAMILKLEEALAKQEQDSTCNDTLRAQGKSYPRTCKKCGLGPCVGKTKQEQVAEKEIWIVTTPEEALDWLAQQHFDQCREERPIQNWIRGMKAMLPKDVP